MLPEDIAMALPRLAKAHDGSDPDLAFSSVSIFSNVESCSDDDDDDACILGRFLQIGHPAVKHSL